MKVFRYIDNNDGHDHHTIYEIEAAGILEADAIYNADTGKNIVKQGLVACAVSTQFSFEPNDWGWKYIGGVEIIDDTIFGVLA